MVKRIPAAEVLRQLLNYNPRTGELIWRLRDDVWFSENFGPGSRNPVKTWNTRFAGKPAGRLRNNRVSVRILGNEYVKSRIVWTLHFGEPPENIIDHINGDTFDDRISNLRDVTHTENNRNQKMSRHNKSGHVGVYFYPRTKKWIASMHINNYPVHLGYFEKKEDAIKARVNAQKEHGFTERHGK